MIYKLNMLIFITACDKILQVIKMRLEFNLQNSGLCKITINDSGYIRHFFLNSEENTTKAEMDIYGNSFDLTIIPMQPDLMKDFDEIEEVDRNTLKGKILYKIASKAANFAKDIFFCVECTYHIENFCDGDVINITSLVYSYRSNDFSHTLWLLSPEMPDAVFPVGYMFYDVLLNSDRIEPKNTHCINRKATIKQARKFVIAGSAIFLQVISYPIQMLRIRYLSREKKIFSSLLKFSKMKEDKRWKFIGDEDFFGNVD